MVACQPLGSQGTQLGGYLGVRWGIEGWINRSPRPETSSIEERELRAFKITCWFALALSFPLSFTTTRVARAENSDMGNLQQKKAKDESWSPSWVGQIYPRSRRQYTFDVWAHVGNFKSRIIFPPKSSPVGRDPSSPRPQVAQEAVPEVD